jgi:hypothetical protein
VNRTFSSLGAFAVFLERAIAAELVADTAARGEVAHFFAEEARKRIGHPEQLPPPLQEATQRERVRLGYAADETLLREGGLQESIAWEPDGTRSTIFGSTSPIAMYHELGMGHEPQRAFLSTTVVEKDAEGLTLYAATFAKMFKPR